MYLIDTLPNHIDLGQQHEHGVSTIVFDITAWSVLYPAGAAAIAAIPGVSDGLWATYTRDGETNVYPIEAADLSLSTVGTIKLLTWTVQAVVTAIAGQGTVVIHCTESGDEKRSAMTKTIVTEGHTIAETAPEPLATYLSLVDTALDNMADAMPVKDTVALTIAGWAGGTTQTVAFAGMTAAAMALVAPISASRAKYYEFGLYCSDQGVNTLTFTATSTPDAEINVLGVMFR